MHNLEGYRAICTEAERLGYSTAYKDDLKVHDLRILMDTDAPQEFAWGVRSTGTDIFFPGKKEYLDLAIACRKHRTNEYYFWIKGASCTQISIDGIIERLQESLGEKE